MLTYDEIAVEGECVADFVRRLGKVYDQGGVLLARFRATNEVVGAEPWFPTSTKLREYESFRGFFGSPAVRAALPGLQVPDPFPVAHPPEFPSLGSWWTLTLDGWLAGLLMAGGAYGQFNDSALIAKAIGERAAEDLVQGRHEDFEAFGSEQAWTTWFHDVAWDTTLLLVDNRRREVTLLATTDTD